MRLLQINESGVSLRCYRIALLSVMLNVLLNRLNFADFFVMGANELAR